MIDMESMQNIIKQITREIIDLKKNKGELNKPFNPFLKKRIKTNSTPQISPTSNINLEDYAIENYYHMHHANHSEITCPKFINYFTIMFLPPEPPNKESNNEKEELDDNQ